MRLYEFTKPNVYLASADEAGRFIDQRERFRQMHNSRCERMTKGPQPNLPDAKSPALDPWSIQRRSR
jgi:hypothetical protein